MALSNYPNGFKSGLLLKNMPIFDAVAGSVYWVDSGAGGAGNPGTFDRPLDTIDNAINKCSANNGDYIYLKPGHSEAISAAAGAVFDTAGITVVGLGTGSAQAQVRFTTAATADIDITAANTAFHNVRFTAAFADVTAAIDVGASAHDTQFHSCRFDEEATGENYVVVITVADGADGLVLDDCDYIGNDASNDHLVEMLGTHERVKIINNRMFHLTAQTAAVAMIESATQQIAMTLSHNYMHSETAAAAASFVVLTGTTNNGFAIGNQISSVDTDATAANAIAAFDVTGLHSADNKFTSGDADGHGIETFTTVENLT